MTIFIFELNHSSQDKMGLKLLGLWTVVLSLSAVNAARRHDCPALEVKDGFFISERDTLSHDTELFYGCNENFKPVEGSWWATVTCQNGTWSSIPKCIENSACFDPKIPNANYTAFQYVKNNERIWIKCNTGYEDKNKRATARCRDGQWSVLPICEKMASWCGPPPQIPNGVIINQVYKDSFPDDAQVEYVCKSGFELETHSNEAICSNGKWLTPPSCRQKQTTEGRVPLETAVVESISPLPSSPSSSGSDDHSQPIFTTIDQCGTPPPVMNGDFFHHENNRQVTYKCNYWYKLKGNREVRCANGHWTPAPTCEVDYCTLDTSRYRELENNGEVFIKTGSKLKVACCKSTWRSARAYCKKDKSLLLSECCLGVTHDVNNCGYSRIRQPQRTG